MQKKRQIAPGTAVTTGRHLYSISHLRALQLLFWDAQKGLFKDQLFFIMLMSLSGISATFCYFFHTRRNLLIIISTSANQSHIYHICKFFHTVFQFYILSGCIPVLFPRILKLAFPFLCIFFFLHLYLTFHIHFFETRQRLTDFIFRISIPFLSKEYNSYECNQL